jgi:K+/H+ antiporter YhaU regulatory subunit KhtT
MKITKKRIVEIIKEELADQASSIGGANVKKLLQQNPAIDKLAAAVAKRVEKLPAQSKALVAAAILQKMGFSEQDMERIKLIIPKLMADEPEEV